MPEEGGMGGDYAFMAILALVLAALLTLAGYVYFVSGPKSERDGMAALQLGRQQAFKLNQCYGKTGDYTKCASVLAGPSSGVMASLTVNSYLIQVDRPKDDTPNVMTLTGTPNSPPIEGCIDHSAETDGMKPGCG